MCGAAPNRCRTIYLGFELEAEDILTAEEAIAKSNSSLNWSNSLRGLHRRLLITVIGALVLLTNSVNVRGQAKQQLDRTNDALKGRVKSVSLEVVRFDLVNNEWVEKPRVSSERKAYDELGNQTRFEDYDDDGKLSSVLIYDFIGKLRVARYIESPTSTTLSRVVPGPKNQKVDPRYTYKFVHQYDAQGRRIQTAVYLSSGPLWLRHVFKFDRNRKIHRTYNREGLNRTLEYTFNEQGNEISVVEHAPYVSADKTVYKYDEFDAQGNWTKRRVYRGLKEFPDSAFTLAHPWSVEYRVITYY